jgi:hypothetical protein
VLFSDILELDDAGSAHEFKNLRHNLCPRIVKPFCHVISPRSILPLLAPKLASWWEAAKTPRTNNRNNPFLFRDAMLKLVAFGTLEYKNSQRPLNTPALPLGKGT